MNKVVSIQAMDLGPCLSVSDSWNIQVGGSMRILRETYSRATRFRLYSLGAFSRASGVGVSIGHVNSFVVYGHPMFILARSFQLWLIWVSLGGGAL